MTKRVAIYPGTFSPVTVGHIDIINRGAKLFDKLYVCVAESQHKTPLFSLEERVNMIKPNIKSDNVEVVGFLLCWLICVKI